MIKNKLICLDYPNPESVNIRDPKSFRQIVLWLEDQKIRHYKIDERAELRKIGNPEWQKAYEKYKADLNCPKELVSAEDQLKWICNHAVKLEYMDNIEDYKSVTSQAEHSQSSAPSVKSVNPFDNLDFNSPQFEAGVRALAKKLLIPHHPDHIVLLDAISKVIKDNLNKDAVKQVVLEGKPFPIFDGPNTSGEDEDVDQAVKILRLLQIQSIRSMQTIINEAIVDVQGLITDAPKTDTRLGQVGR